MPNYRGIDQKEVADSIRKGAAFVKRLNIGPAINEHIAPLLDEAKISKIEQAQTEKDLVAAVRASNADHLFNRIEKLLHYHAKVNSKREGADVYYQLSRWGAFGGFQFADYTPIHAEIDKHLRLRPLKYFPREPKTADAFGRYGVVFPTQDTKNFQKMQDDNHALIASVHALLEPQQELDKVLMIGIGGVGKTDFDNLENNKSGVSFVATRDVAQAIADAFPDHSVINSNDGVIAPTQTKSHVAQVQQRRAASSQEQTR